MHSNSKLERTSARKRRILICILNITCVVMLGFVLVQHTHIYVHCGMDLRSPAGASGDPTLEQLVMTGLEIILAIAGLLGIWTKRGAIYFVVVSFLLCTIMIHHAVDLLLGIIYLYDFKGEFKEAEKFLRENYRDYKLSKPFTVFKMDRLHRCMACCGINGTNDAEVHLTENILIASCCPSRHSHPCTNETAYKKGCAHELLTIEGSLKMFHGISVVVIILEFCIYRAFLSIYITF